MTVFRRKNDDDPEVDGERKGQVVVLATYFREHMVCGDCGS